MEWWRAYGSLLTFMKGSRKWNDIIYVIMYVLTRLSYFYSVQLKVFKLSQAMKTCQLWSRVWHRNFGKKEEMNHNERKKILPLQNYSEAWFVCVWLWISGAITMLRLQSWTKQMWVPASTHYTVTGSDFREEKESPWPSESELRCFI